MKHRSLTGLPLVAALSLSLAACGPAPEAGPESPEAQPPPADGAELVVRARDAVRERTRVFDVVEMAGGEVVRSGRVATYPASDKPVFDLVWESDEGATRLRSDGTTVTAERASGEVLFSPWSEAGTVLYSREAGKLLPTALDARNFRNYPSRLEEDAEEGVWRAVAPFPGGGSWTIEVDAVTWLPRSAAFRSAPDTPVERLTLEPVAGADAPPVSELALAPEAAARATRFYAGPAPGDPAPDVAFELVDGTRVALADLRGKVVVVDFWATWCVPCRPAMTKLEELYREYGDEGLEVYGLRLYDSGDASEYLAGLGVTYPIGDGAPFEKPYAVDTYGLPTLYVIDRQGRIVNLVVGFSPAGEDTLVRAVERAIAA